MFNIALVNYASIATESKQTTKLFHVLLLHHHKVNKNNSHIYINSLCSTFTNLKSTCTTSPARHQQIIHIPYPQDSWFSLKHCHFSQKYLQKALLSLPVRLSFVVSFVRSTSDSDLYSAHVIVTLYWWLSARLQYLHCQCTGDTAVFQ